LEKLGGRILVLNVDRDNDIGDKTGLETPIIGREQCLEAAAKLCLVDPEEADANAIFATVKMYDELVAKGLDCGIGVLAGTAESGFEADQKVRREATVVISSIKPDGLVLVSDGIEDEKLAPILQSLVPIVSIKRVVIKHSASVEESYEVLARYLKMLIYDPRYSKFFLGVPGALLLLYSLMSFSGLNPSYYAYTLALVLGFSFLVRAFDLDKTIIEARRRTFFYPRLFAFVISLIMVAVGFYEGYNYILTLPEYAKYIANPSDFWVYFHVFAGNFIAQSVPLIWLAVATNLGVTLAYHALRRSAKTVRDAIAIVSLSLLYFPILGLGGFVADPTKVNPFIFISLLLAGLAALVIVVYFAFTFYQGRRSLSRDEN
jgi:putative membrane protein